MLGRSFESVLSECLDAMRHGATLDDCLARYPRHARRLAPQLALAQKVSRTPLVAARPEAEARAWRAVQARAAELRSGKARPRAVRISSAGFGWLKPVAITAVFAGMFAGAGGGVLYAAQDASPDSSLYAVKLAGEDMRLWFVFDDAREAEILLDQSKQRMTEINETVRDGKPVPENAMAAMHNRNERATEIITGLPVEPNTTVLRERLLTQAEEQERRLLAIWPQVRPEDQTTYARTVAHLHNTQLGAGVAVADIQLRPEALSGGILTISGLAELGDDGIWRIGGFEVRIDGRTFGRDNVRAGSAASVLAAKSSNGQLTALTADVANVILPTAVVSGAVERITDEGITVSGQFIPFSSSTVPLGQLKIGERVQVQVHSSGGGIYAGSISQFAPSQNDDQTFWYEGTLEGDVSRSTNHWSVGGMTFQITPSTTLDARAGGFANGVRVQIEATNDSGTLRARRVTVLSSQAGAQTVNVLGTFQGYDEDDEAWKIAGISVQPPENADPNNDPPTGSLVMAEASQTSGGLVASRIEVVQEPDGPQLIQLEGTILAIDISRWTLEIGQVRVASTARVRGGSPEAGKRVILWVTQGQDSLNATYARILDESPVVTPAPAVTDAPAP
jgi:hypothetical protein